MDGWMDGWMDGLIDDILEGFALSSYHFTNVLGNLHLRTD